MLALVTLSAFLVALVRADSPTGGPVSGRSYPPPVPEPSTKPVGCGMGQIACPGLQDECISLIFMCDDTTDCSDGSDESNCGVLPATSTSSTTSSATGTDSPIQIIEAPFCAPGEVPCASDPKICIQEMYVCDNWGDCPDDTDEEGCDGGEEEEGCDEGYFNCVQEPGKCIPEDYVCDFTNDCDDGSDEANCGPKLGCAPDQFACKNDPTTCYPDSMKCDGTFDCLYDDDEMGCGFFSVSPETSPTFSPSTSPTAPGKCPNEDDMMCPMSTVQVCVKYTAICDGEYDCPDGEDESDEACEFIINNGIDGGNNGRHGGNNGPDYGTGDPDWRQIGDMAIHAINVVEETLDHVLNVFRCIFHPAHCVENEMPGVEDGGSYSP